ncbi:MAG: hypothetical protein ACTSXQ_03395 [Alphaproteobacteria bacterium]
MIWLLTIPPFNLLLILFIPFILLPLLLISRTRAHIFSCYRFSSIMWSLFYYKIVATTSFKSRMIFFLYSLSLSSLLILSCIFLEPKIANWQSEYILDQASDHDQKDTFDHCGKVLNIPA